MASPAPGLVPIPWGQPGQKTKLLAKFPKKSSNARAFQAVFYSGLRFPCPPAVSYEYNEPKMGLLSKYSGRGFILGFSGQGVCGEGKAKASPTSLQLWPHCLSYFGSFVSLGAGRHRKVRYHRAGNGHTLQTKASRGFEFLFPVLIFGAISASSLAGGLGGGAGRVCWAGQ